MDELTPDDGFFWIVMQRDGMLEPWRVHTPRPRTAASAEQFAADLNALGSTGARGLRYAAAAITVRSGVVA